MQQRNTGLLAALLLTVLTITAIVTAGGCGGSSDGTPPAAKQAKLYTIGEVSDATIAKLRGASIDVIQYDPFMAEKVPLGSSFVLEHNSIEVVEPGSATAKKMKECVFLGGEIVLVSSDKSERDYLYENILTGYSRDDSDEGTLPIFAVSQETSGDIRTFASLGDSSIASEDVLAEVHGLLAIESGDKFVVISGDEELGNQETIDDNFKLVIKPDALVASGDSKALICEGAVSGDVVYSIIDGIVQSSDLVIEADTEPASDDLTDEEWNCLREWLLEEPDPQAQAQLQARALEAVKARIFASPAYAADTIPDNKNLLKIGQSFVKTATQTIKGKTYSISVFIVGAHDFENDKDWYYVEQECSINGSDGYTKFWKKGGERVENYMKSVTAANELLINGAAVGGEIVPISAQPRSTNKEVSHTETFSWNFGGKVGVTAKGSGPEAAGELSFGIGASNSKSWKVSDVELRYDAGNNKPTWIYTYNNAPRDSKKAGRWTRMDEAPVTDLSRSTFIFYNFWVWGIDSDKRAGNPTLKVTPSLVTGRTWTRGNGTLPCGRKETAATGSPILIPFSSKAAPLLALDTHNVDLGSSAAKAKYITVAAKGTWGAAVASGGEWCKVLTTPDRILIETTENKTGAPRTTKITVTRTGTTDKQVVTVIQSSIPK